MIDYQYITQAIYMNNPLINFSYYLKKKKNDDNVLFIDHFPISDCLSHHIDIRSIFSLFL